MYTHFQAVLHDNIFSDTNAYKNDSAVAQKCCYSTKEDYQGEN